jgi:hypothetical protein
MAPRDNAAILLICAMTVATGTARAHERVTSAFLPAATAQADAMKMLGLDAVVRAARADAARRTGMTAETLELLSADSVTWRDGSLGCPQPGMAYTQALVPGWRIRLRAMSQDFDYHANKRGVLVLCPAGQAVEPLPDGRV